MKVKNMIELPDNLKWDLKFANDTDFRKVANYQKVIDIYKSAILQIQHECEHKIFESHFYSNGRLIVPGGISPCPKCNLRIEGWFCPKSKTNQCEYKIGDQCIHCGHPEERK